MTGQIVRTAFIAIAVGGLSLLLTSCDKTGGLPPTDKGLLEMAWPETLVGLFKRDCLELRNLDWARAEEGRLQRNCGGLFIGDGETGDCQQAIDGRVAWRVPTSTGSTIVVELSWWPTNGPPGRIPSRPSCSLGVPESLGHLLQAAAAEVKVGSGAVRLTSQLVELKSELVAGPCKAARKPCLELDHYDVAAVGHERRRWAGTSRWEFGYSQMDVTAYPWVLRYVTE